MTHDEIVLALREVSNTPMDRTSIRQDLLDLANRTRTSRFAWRGQFSLKWEIPDLAWEGG